MKQTTTFVRPVFQLSNTTCHHSSFSGMVRVALFLKSHRETAGVYLLCVWQWWLLSSLSQSHGLAHSARTKVGWTNRSIDRSIDRSLYWRRSKRDPYTALVVLSRPPIVGPLVETRMIQLVTCTNPVPRSDSQMCHFTSIPWP
jgi:hypothetical protein